MSAFAASGSVLEQIHRKGASVWVENGQLRYRAPRGTLTDGDLRALRDFKHDIIAILESQDTALMREQPAAHEVGHAPLTYSQLAHWRMHQLGEQAHLRQIASATHLLGPLDVTALRESVTEVVQRHQALRTLIVQADGVPHQRVHEHSDIQLEVVDLSAAAERDQVILQQIEECILEPVHATEGPLAKLRLLRLAERDHVLVIAMEHIVADGLSGGTLLRDLLAIYQQKSSGKAVALPPIPVQYTQYAGSQRRAEPQWIARHGGYWDERLQGRRRLSFPSDDRRLLGADTRGWGAVPVHIGAGLKAELVEWSRARHTTLAMSVLAAYFALVLRWCEVSHGVIRYQTDGRTTADVANTIGYFAFALHLRIELNGDDQFVDVVNQVTAEYCRAYEHADYAYIDAQVPRPDISRSSVFNWMPIGAQAHDSFIDGGSSLSCAPISFVHPMMRSLEWDAEPSIMLFDGDEGIGGHVFYPRSRFSVATMERFALNLTVFLEAMARRPDLRVATLPLQ